MRLSLLARLAQRRQRLRKTTPLPPDPHLPGHSSAGAWKAAACGGTLPHPLENATRFPQTCGHDYEEREKGACKILIVAAAQR